MLQRQGRNIEHPILTPYLVGGLRNMNGLFFPSYWNFIIPTDFKSIIFQRGRSTTNQMPLKFPLDPIKPP